MLIKFLKLLLTYKISKENKFFDKSFSLNYKKENNKSCC